MFKVGWCTLAISEEIKHFVECCLCIDWQLGSCVKSPCAFAIRARVEAGLFLDAWHRHGYGSVETNALTFITVTKLDKIS